MSNEPSASMHHSGRATDRAKSFVYIYLFPPLKMRVSRKIYGYISLDFLQDSREHKSKNQHDGQSIIRSAGETSSIQMMTINSQSKIFIKSPLMLYIIIIHRAVSFENEGNILQTAPHSLPLNYIFPMNVF